jgi:hypothetical protein
MKKVFIIAGILAVSTTSCLKDIFCINGNRDLETEYRNTELFSEVSNSTAIDVIYMKADSVSVIVTAETNLFDHIVTETSGGILEIRTSPRNSCIDFNRKPLIVITSPELVTAVLSGSGDMTADTLSGEAVTVKCTGSGDLAAGTIICKDLFVTLTGSGDIGIGKATCQNPDIVITGSGDLGIAGSGINAVYKVTGSGDINSYEFPVENATETITGSGDIQTRVENILNAVLTGSGNIYLKGDPVINQTITGSGRIIRR